LGFALQDLLEKPWSYRKQFCGFTRSSDCLPINGCGQPWAAQLYYQSFTLLITHIFILEGFAVADREASSVLSKTHLRAFQRVWQSVDPQAHGLVHFQELRNIIRALPPPLGFQGLKPTERQFRQLFKRMPVRLYRGSMVTFWEVAKYLAIIVYEDDAKLKDGAFLPAGSKLLDVEARVSAVAAMVMVVMSLMCLPPWILCRESPGERKASWQHTTSLPLFKCTLLRMLFNGHTGKTMLPSKGSQEVGLEAAQLLLMCILMICKKT
jgi:hypothetical protein